MYSTDPCSDHILVYSTDPCSDHILVYSTDPCSDDILVYSTDPCSDDMEKDFKDLKAEFAAAKIHAFPDFDSK